MLVYSSVVEDHKPVLSFFYIMSFQSFAGQAFCSVLNVARVHGSDHLPLASLVVGHLNKPLLINSCALHGSH